MQNVNNIETMQIAPPIEEGSDHDQGKQSASEQPGPSEYREMGFKALRLRGYNDRLNPQQDYKKAKQPVTTKYTAKEYAGLSPSEIGQAEKQDYWTGWVVGPGLIVIDSEHPGVLSLIQDLISSGSSLPSIQWTNRGKQYIYKYTGNYIPASSEYFCAGGFPLTPRIAGKNYAIMPPTNGRTWDNWTPHEDLPELPPELMPHDPKNIIHVARCLSWAVGEAYGNNQLAGYEDLDCSFLALLDNAGLSLDEIKYCFKLIFKGDYDDARTESMHSRYKEKKKSGESVIGAGSFIKKIQDSGLNKISSWLKKMNKLSRGTQSVALRRDNETSPYFVDEQGYLMKKKYDGDGWYPMRLANFVLRIVEQITEDDGNEIIHKYRLEGSCRGRQLPQIEILAAQFNGMTWLYQYGSLVIIEPGNTIRDTVRHAIQMMSDNTIYRRTFIHTGWCEINNNMVFLSHGSAIGDCNVDVQLAKESARYSIPATPENEQEAIRASLSMLNIGKPDVMLSLLAITYIAPLTSVFEKFIPINFSFYIYGPTGTFKTTLAVLMLCHYGNFNASSLPNLEDTANSVERKAFLLKDVPMVLDDHHPSGSQKEAHAKDSLVQRVIRAFGNRTGRGRLNSDSKEKGRYAPRGVLMITGEEITSLQSTIARIFVVEINKGDVNIEKLTELQALADQLPHAMSSFINWLRENMVDVQKKFPSRFSELRKAASEGAVHRKLPEQVAFLTFTLEVVSSWLTDKGVFTEAEGEKLVKDGLDTFRQLTEQHGERIREEDPVRKFEDIILTLERTNKVALGVLDGR